MAKKRKRICHISSVHRGLDVRIFHKECVSAARAGFDVHLVIYANDSDIAEAARKGVTIHALPPTKGRISRMLLHTWRCFVKARKLNADIYQFHDPELMLYGMLLALGGGRVIYDVHEDVPMQILSKDWIPLLLRKLVGYAVCLVEFIGAKWAFSAVVASPYIKKRFCKATENTININNFPLLNEVKNVTSWDVKAKEVCYIGGITKIRGIEELCCAMNLTESGARLTLAGDFSEPHIKRKSINMPGWRNVRHVGYVDRHGVHTILQRSMVGLATLHPLKRHMDGVPIKIFEYMSAGIPVIASDFPLWRDIIEVNDCGLLVDPMDPNAIARAIDFLVSQPNIARAMGENGRRIVEQKYDWRNEEKLLIKFYKSILA